MESKYTYFFRELSKNNINLVGGKGANLGEMYRAGLPVPEGFCISVAAYRQVVDNLKSAISQILTGIDWERPLDIEEKALTIRELILQQPVPEEIEQEIIIGYFELSGGELKEAAVAVRSSATAEDLPEASFAGQQETYLNVRGRSEVLVHVKKCWASLWTARAMAYRQRNDYDHTSVYLSVVIQKIIQAEVAGVAFTVNPLNSNAEEMLITSAYGLGEVVVAGTVTPDTFTLSKKSLVVLSRELGSKEKEMVGIPGGNTNLLDVSAEKRTKYSLSDSSLTGLGKLILKVEEHYGSPQDIEWAVSGGRMYLLQSRPITTLQNTSQASLFSGKITKTQKFMLDDFLEHYPEAPAPLDYSVVILSYQALLNWGIDLGVKAPRAEEIISRTVDGAINLYPPRVGPSPKMLLAPFKLFKAAKKSPDHWNQYLKTVESLMQKIRSLQLKDEKNEVLIQLFQQIFSTAETVCNLRFFYLIEANAVPMAVLSMVLKIFADKANRPSTTDLTTTGLDYKTAIIDREINRLAVELYRNDELTGLILKHKGILSDFMEKAKLIPESAQFLNMLEEFLRAYGNRTEKMYQPFSSKSWAEDPTLFLILLRAALQDPFLLERETKDNEAKRKHKAWVKKFQIRLSGLFRKLFDWSYHKLRENHIIREETLFALEGLFSSARRITGEIGNRLVKAGCLSNPEEIRFLTREEIPGILLGEITPENCLKLIQTRKNNFTINQRLWKKALFDLSEENHPNEGVKGLPGSPGLAEGPARIVMNVKDFDKLKKGDILVCPYTDPTWTPLFGIAAAVVADTGGPLSHAAIVAREYGIPAVLGTKVGTAFFKDGEKVIVEGNKGLVFHKDEK